MRLNRVVYRFWHNKSPAGRVGYIGKDSHYPDRINLSRRSREKSCRKFYRALNKYPKDLWHVEVLAKGFRSDKALIKAEIYWIKKFDSKNGGYNCTDGGEGIIGLVHSKASREKMSIARKGRKQSPEHIANRVESRKGWKHSTETKQKLSKSHKGKKLSADHKKRIGEGAKNPSIETRKKMSLARLGKKLSPETRAKMSLAQMGNKKALGVIPSADTRNKISKALKGRKFSDETKVKMSEARKRDWVKRKAAQAKLNEREEGTNAG